MKKYNLNKDPQNYPKTTLKGTLFENTAPTPAIYDSKQVVEYTEVEEEYYVPAEKPGRTVGESLGMIFNSLASSTLELLGWSLYWIWRGLEFTVKYTILSLYWLLVGLLTFLKIIVLVLLDILSQAGPAGVQQPGTDVQASADRPVQTYRKPGQTNVQINVHGGTGHTFNTNIKN
jgi:hypothetical protein